MREGFISTEVFVWSQMALAFGFPLWFGWSQLRALRRMREREAAGRDEAAQPQE